MAQRTRDTREGEAAAGEPRLEDESRSPDSEAPDAEAREPGAGDADEPRDPEAESALDPDASPEEVAAELRRQRDEYKARWQRAQADYKNARRRGLAEQEASIRRSLQPILDDCLLVLDHLDMALACPAELQETRNVILGVQMTRDQLVAALARRGVVAIPDGGTFDPAVHQAMETVHDSSVEPGTVVATIRRGFRWGDSVLRFAQVRVAARPAGDSTRPSDDPPRED